MSQFYLILGLLTIVSLTTFTSAGPIKTCPTTGVCYSVVVPESSAQFGSGNLYFQISAPTSYAWVALGTGTRMSGSNMFIMYQDGTGNVTMSPRLGTEYIMPVEDTGSDGAKLTLLAGSGVSGDAFTANVRCSNCNSWRGGTLDLAGSLTSWIAAWKSGSSLATANKDAPLNQHDDTSRFTLDLTKATITEDTNPFLNNTTLGGSSVSSTVTSTQASASSSSHTTTVPSDASATAQSTGTSSGISAGAKAGIGVVAAIGGTIILVGLRL